MPAGDWTGVPPWPQRASLSSPWPDTTAPLATPPLTPGTRTPDALESIAASLARIAMALEALDPRVREALASMAEKGGD